MSEAEGSHQGSEGPLIKHTGGCHCGAVRFEVRAPAVLETYNCSCSICVKKQIRPFLVPKSDFKLLQGEDKLTCYTYHKHEAKHTFCKICGVQSFYAPRGFPDQTGINYYCLDPGTMKDMTVVKFDGASWD